MKFSSGEAISVQLGGAGLDQALESADADAPRYWEGFRLRIMEQCGGEAVPGTGVAESADGLEYNFTTITAAGGLYELCWCIGIEPYLGCAFNAHFGMKVGDVLFDGPSGGETHTCVKSGICKLEGLLGEGLAAGDLVFPSPATQRPCFDAVEGGRNWFGDNA